MALPVGIKPAITGLLNAHGDLTTRAIVDALPKFTSGDIYYALGELSHDGVVSRPDHLAAKNFLMRRG